MNAKIHRHSSTPCSVSFPSDAQKQMTHVSRWVRSLCAALLAMDAASAQDIFDIPVVNLPSSVTLEGGGDAAGSRSLILQGDVGLPSGMRLRAGYAGTRVDSGSAAYVSDTYWAGVNSDPLAGFSYGANYEAMQRDDQLGAGAFKANLRWRIDRWRLAVYPELRWISFTQSVQGQHKTRSVETVIRSPGLGVALAYNAADAWSLGFRHVVYRYASDAQTLPSHPAFARLVSSNIDQAFDIARSSVTADYTPAWGSVGVEATRSESAIDHVIAHSAAVNLNWDVSRAWTVFARVGRSRVDEVAAARFGSAGVTWMWDQ